MLAPLLAYAQTRRNCGRDRSQGTRSTAQKRILLPSCDQGMRASIPIPDMDHRTECLSADQFRYEAERDVYLCPAGKELRFFPAHSRCAFPSVSSSRQGVQPLPASSAQCTTSTRGRSLCCCADEACLERVRAYQSTAAYKKALRKRQVWVEPLMSQRAMTGMACAESDSGGCGGSNMRR